MSRSAAHGRGLHPLAVLVATVPAMILVLVADRPWFALVALGCCALASLVRGARVAVVVVLSAVALLGIIRLGMDLWLPAEAATSGALRIVALSALMAVPTLFIDRLALADTLIDRLRAPYRVIDVVLLGDRFGALICADLRTAARMARLRARGGVLRRARMLCLALVPVLVAGFRQGDELAIAMDARGFGAHETRTVHRSRPVRVRDLAALGVVWAASIVLALVLERC
ncbi:MAG: hypothetical protein ACTHZX_03745 [Microbacterium sp.]